MDLPATFTRAAADLAALLDDYTASGLFEPEGKAATRLVGNREATGKFRRLCLLSSGLLRNVIAGALLKSPANPRHAVVIGGTNVGKSTLVNVLLGEPLAGIHHLGAATRHDHGFLSADVDERGVFRGNPFSFQQLSRVPASELEESPLSAYALTKAAGSPMREMVLWDVPDIDSVKARDYLPAVIEAVSVADVVVYVTSQEKYAVDWLVEWVIGLLRAGIPVVGVLNKVLPAQQADLVVHAGEVLQQVAARDGWPPPPVPMTPLPFADLEVLFRDGGKVAPAALRDAVAEIRAQIKAAPTQRSAERLRATVSYLRSVMPQVLEPAALEFQARTDWDTAVGTVTATFLDDYRANYLDNPKRFDAFGRLGLRLLELLNPPVPGLQEGVRFLRIAFSLPAQVILRVGKFLWNLAIRARSQGLPPGQRKLLPEEQTYVDSNVRLLNTISATIQEHQRAPRHHPFWDDIEGRWTGELGGLEEQFQQRLERHAAEVQQRIDRAAEDIYHQIETQPVVLNTLRMSRVTADAAALVIGLVAGAKLGAGPVADLVYDALFAPALLALTEAAARQLADQFVENRKAQLREELFDETQAFVLDVYRDRLKGVADEAMAQTGLLRRARQAAPTLQNRLNGVLRLVDPAAQ